MIFLKEIVKLEIIIGYLKMFLFKRIKCYYVVYGDLFVRNL